VVRGKAARKRTCNTAGTSPRGPSHHSVSPRASCNASSPGVRAIGSCDPSRSSAQSRAPGTRPAWSHASRGYYGLCLPPERTTVAHVCSMFARMSRYGPVAVSITRHPLSWFAVQSGRSRHASVQNGTRQWSKIEQSSGLLIRGFGVRVPGGAPVNALATSQMHDPDSAPAIPRAATRAATALTGRSAHWPLTRRLPARSLAVSPTLCATDATVRSRARGVPRQ
jgi:hypothetical protein